MLPAMKLVLASTSPYRRALMERLGLTYEAAAPRFVEKTSDEIPDPRALVKDNAVGKARSLVADHPEQLIIGSDQVVACEGEVFTKPGSHERAVAQLLRLAGAEHELLTAVAVLAPGGERAAKVVLVENRLRMRALTPADAEAYVRLEQPLCCAGAYKFEQLGIALFDHVRGDDPTAIVGLPLIALLRLLRQHGVDPLRRGEAT